MAVDYAVAAWLCHSDRTVLVEVAPTVLECPACHRLYGPSGALIPGVDDIPSRTPVADAAEQMLADYVAAATDRLAGMVLRPVWRKVRDVADTPEYWADTVQVHNDLLAVAGEAEGLTEDVERLKAALARVQALADKLDRLYDEGYSISDGAAGEGVDGLPDELRADILAAPRQIPALLRRAAELDPAPAETGEPRG